jgi:hypothetical protein
MAQYIAYDPTVKVFGALIESVIDTLEYGQDTRRALLEKHGFKSIDPTQWYPQQKWLDVFKDISREIGDKTLYLIGKKVPSKARLPQEINTLEKALHGINVGYRMNHSSGEIGVYEVLDFYEKSRKATVRSSAPYPSEFDRGLIMAFLIRFKPKDSVTYDVILDVTKETRLNGGNSCTYIISW